MVIVIADAASSVSVTVGYNEQKVSEGTASVAYCSNIEDKSDPMKTFQQYENASVRTEKLSFHASINPAPGEKLDKDRFRRDLGGVEAAYAEVMKRLSEHI